VKKEQVLGHELTPLGYLVVLRITPVQLAVDEGQGVGQGQAAIEDPLFLQELLNRHELLEIPGHLECVVRVGFERDEEGFYAGKIPVDSLGVPDEGVICFK